MRWLDTRILCVALLVFGTVSGCAPRYGRYHVSQCGQGHSSLLDYYVSRTHPHHGHGPCAEGPCAEGPCDVDCYQRPVPPQPGAQPAPPRPSEPTTRIIRPRPRRRWIDRSGDSLEFSIPLPSRWIGSTESAAEIPEPEETIPWNNAPVATASPTRTAITPEAPQVVGYEYGVPVELQSPNFGETDDASGHSLYQR